MSKLPAAFDSNQHDDMQGGFDAIPAAECKEHFLAHVTGSDLKDTKAKTGKYISLEFTLLEGKYKGRKIWTNLNIINPNPVAVEIAQKELATLCRACGLPQIQDTAQLHNIPVLMKLKYVPAKGDFPDKNEPCGYVSASGGATGAASSTGTASAGGAEGGGKAPWAKKKPEVDEAPNTEEGDPGNTGE
jgi:hypothetical protein